MDTPERFAAPPAAEARHELLALLRQVPRGAANRQGERVNQLCLALERMQPADLGASGALELLEGVWELRWSSSRQPYLAVGPWLENLQLLAPSQGRAMNLLRLPGALAPLAGVAVEAAITVEEHAPAASLGQPQPAPATPCQRVAVRFRRGGWLGPALGNTRLQLLRRPDLRLADLLLPLTSAPAPESPAGPGPA